MLQKCAECSKGASSTPCATMVTVCKIVLVRHHAMIAVNILHWPEEDIPPAFAVPLQTLML